MRLFFAVSLNDGVKSAMDAAVRRSSIVNPPWRWVRPENLHITLKFLGEMDETSVDGLVRHASLACSGIKPFSISFDQFGGFPNLARPRVLFFRADLGSQELRSLAERLEGVLEEHMGIAREKRPFRPHVTVARVKTSLTRAVRNQLESVAPLTGVSQEVTALSLMRSELGREGAKYYSVKEIALGSG